MIKWGNTPPIFHRRRLFLNFKLYFNLLPIPELLLGAFLKVRYCVFYSSLHKMYRFGCFSSKFFWPASYCIVGETIHSEKRHTEVIHSKCKINEVMPVKINIANKVSVVWFNTGKLLWLHDYICNILIALLFKYLILFY